MLLKMMSPIERQNPSLVMGVSLVLVAGLGVADYLTGYEIAFSIFYVLPIALTAYFAGRRSSLMIALLSAVAWLWADVAAGQNYVWAWILYWNTFTRLLFFSMVAVFLDAMKKSLEHEKELARSDFLTGAANSRAFYEAANRELDRARRYGHPFSVAHLDIDNFKTVNDTLGHQAGDDLLCAIVKTMQSQLRDTDLVARLGGDEFALLLPETAADKAAVALKKLHIYLNEEADRQKWPITFSIGLLTCLDAPGSVDDLLKRVDKLTYDAKGSGKDRIRQDVFAARPVPSRAERNFGIILDP